jgi:thiol peroxidase
MMKIRCGKFEVRALTGMPVAAAVLLLAVAWSVWGRAHSADMDPASEPVKAQEGGETIMQERSDIVTMKGKPVTLIGRALKKGDKAPEFEVVQNDLSPLKFSPPTGKTHILVSVPSLDTAVCDRETHRFNEEAAKLGDTVEVFVLSMDLPFAQKRWCGAAGVSNVKTLSDHRLAAFGKEYGVLVKGLRLLARAVFVVDREGTIRYLEIVKEMSSEPDYDAALKAVKELH